VEKFYLIIYLYPSGNSLKGLARRRIFSLNGLNNASSRNLGVPFGSFVDIPSHFGSAIQPKPQFWGREEAF